MTDLLPLGPMPMMFNLTVTARQWQAAKMRPTQFGSNKNRPGRNSAGTAFCKEMYEMLRKQDEKTNKE
jgi:hypothetical protein